MMGWTVLILFLYFFFFLPFLSFFFVAQSWSWYLFWLLIHSERFYAEYVVLVLIMTICFSSLEVSSSQDLNLNPLSFSIWNDNSLIIMRLLHHFLLLWSLTLVLLPLSVSQLLMAYSLLQNADSSIQVVTIFWLAILI